MVQDSEEGGGLEMGRAIYQDGGWGGVWDWVFTVETPVEAIRL